MSDLINKEYDNNLLGVLSFTMDKVKELADAGSVLGERIEMDGLTIIPVSKVSAGFAGGGADMADMNKKKRQVPAGTGGNITVTPMSFLVIDGKEVKLVNVNSEEKKSALTDVISSVVEKIKSSKNKK